MQTDVKCSDKGNGLYEGSGALGSGGTWQVTITAQKNASADLKLRKATVDETASQLSDVEWLMSMPGTAAQKQALRGCNHCHGTGYRGRTGIFELLKMNAGIREMTFNREPTQTIRRKARSLGMRTLLEDGINKALRGITTLEEVVGACDHEIETDVTH